jgi:calpain-15
MESQDYESIIEECGDSKWTDPLFPAKNSSLCSAQEWSDDPYGSYEWTRANKIPCLTDDEGDLNVFSEDPTPSDIKQGALGDCYFLSSLSVIAENPERIKKMFLVSEVNE